MAVRKYDHELVIAELKRGTDRAVIAKMVGCPVRTVHTMAGRYGLSQPRQPKYDLDLIRRGLERGTPAEAIAAQAGCPVDYVYRQATRQRQAALAPKPARAPSSPTQTAALYEPITGVSEEDAARVRGDLKRRGLDELIAMLGLSQEVAA